VIGREDLNLRALVMRATRIAHMNAPCPWISRLESAVGKGGVEVIVLPGDVARMELGKTFEEFLEWQL